MATQKSDAEKMLQRCIYYRMKNKNLHEVAELFAQEANLKIPDTKEANLEIPNAKETNLEISELELDDEPLTIFWESLWPTFVSTSSETREAGVESSKKQAMETALVTVAGQKTPESSWRRAAKQPRNTEVDYVIGQLATGNMMAAQASRNELLRFPCGQMNFDAITWPFVMPTSGNPSHEQLPAFEPSIVHVTRDPRDDFAIGSSNQMDSTPLPGPYSGYPTAAYLNADESSQMQVTGRGVSEGGERSSGLRIPTVYLEYMRREVQAVLAAANPPQYTFSQEVQGGSGTSRTDIMRNETPGWGVTRWNDPNSAHASTPAGEEAEGENNGVQRTGSRRRKYY